MRRWLPFYLMLVLVLALAAFSMQLVFAQTDSGAAPAGQTIQLKKTDTLVALAAQFSKPVACLQKANKMDAANFSLTGMTTILIPDTCDAATTSVSAGTPTPETADSLATATFTPIPSGSTQPTATFTPSAGTIATLVPTVVADQTYTVVKGDRLTKIAEKFGLTVACIANTNGITNPDLIYVGQQLHITANCDQGAGGGTTTTGNIPASTGNNPRACQFDRNAGRVVISGDHYTVQPGDALDYIACDFGVELKCLKTSNPQLGGFSALMPGQVLNINFSCPIWRDSTLPTLP